jgi:hypothetical protein
MHACVVVRLHGLLQLMEVSGEFYVPAALHPQKTHPGRTMGVTTRAGSSTEQKSYWSSREYNLW